MASTVENNTLNSPVAKGFAKEMILERRRRRAKKKRKGPKKPKR